MKKSPTLLTLLRKKLLDWYRSHKRDLPWRRTKNAYKIWVSEIMLQQTQVATAIPYYKTWFLDFPTLSALSRAPLSGVLKLWAGLGYYRRARMLHQAARYVQKELQGKIPETALELQKLPGIGRYTAGAIASIAWGEKVPVLDGNVIRILTRIFAIPESIDVARTQEKLWGIAGSLLPHQDPGDLNQALMELGAMVCFPWNPACARCPVKKYCAAHEQGKELSFPVRSRKDFYQKIGMAALVLHNRKGRVWMEKQSEEGRWGGLWTFPFWPGKKAMLADMAKQKLRPVFWMTLPHAFTKYRVTLEVYRVPSEREKPLGEKRYGKWFSGMGLSGAAMPSPHRKIARALASLPQKKP